MPYGTYRIDQGLLIASNTRLVVHPEARLFFADGAGRHAADFLISNRHPDAGDANISISGGIWDGNNRHNPRGREGDMDAYTGTLINMKNVVGLELRNIRLADATVHKTGGGKNALFCLEARMDNFRLVNIRRNLACDTCPEAPLLGIRNVRQAQLVAEYRTRQMAADPKLRSWGTVAGGSCHVRQEASACVREFTIQDSEHIVELLAGNPVLHDLPPANNRVGLSEA